MTISEAIKIVGDENVRFQLLDTDAAGATRSKSATKFSFYTGEADPGYLLGGHDKICLILWMPRKAWEDALKQADDQPHPPQAGQTI